MPDKVRKCRTIGCKAAEDGECLENLALDECPNFYLAEDDDFTPPEKTPDTSDDFDLFQGEEIPLKDLTSITFQYSALPIILVGESDCGKTTLLATLFDLLQMGAFQGYFFAGSLTQIGFERRCYEARVHSGNDIPGTPKTNLQSDDSFLHICLKQDPEALSAVHFVLSDIAGERFQRARDSSSNMAAIPILKVVQNIIYMIDGEKLASLTTRNSTISSAYNFIKRALDMNIFTKETKLKIVVSKWDALHSLSNFDYQEGIVGYFTNKFSETLQSLSFLKIAIRPKLNKDKFDLGHGIKELLDDWFYSIPGTSIYPPADFTHSVVPRFFNNFNINR